MGIGVKNIRDKVNALLLEMTRAEAFSILQQAGVDPSKPAAENKMAFRKAAKRMHPDTGGTHEQFTALSGAWDIYVGKSPASPDAPPSGHPQSSWKKPDPKPPGFNKGEEWARAGVPEGKPIDLTIKSNDFSDRNFIRKTLWEMSARQTKEIWTVYAWAEGGFKASVTAYSNGNRRSLATMEEAMKTFMEAYPERFKGELQAIFAMKRTGGDRQLLLIGLDGRQFPTPLAFKYEGDQAKLEQLIAAKLPLILNNITRNEAERRRA